MMESGLKPKFAWCHGACDPNPSLILPPFLVCRPVQTNGTSVADALLWNMHGVDKILRRKQFYHSYTQFSLSQLCYCRTSDKYHYLREKVAGGTPVWLLWTEPLYLPCSCKSPKILLGSLSKKAKPGRPHPSQR